MLDVDRVIAELKELRDLTSDSSGAQRLAWGPNWHKAREWLKHKLSQLPLVLEQDAAGNLWATLPGASSRTVAIGGHLDSVPNGGWLDGALNVVTALELMRVFASKDQPAVTIRLVDWADEEGARFGKSLFGSSSASGSINLDEVRDLRDQQGLKLTEVLQSHRVELDQVKSARRQLENISAYLELHIEQGPVLENLKLPLAVVLGSVGVMRHRLKFSGQTAHAGTTPMNLRRDALSAAARFILEIRKTAINSGGVATVGCLQLKPGISSAIAGECDLLLEQRHLDSSALQAMVDQAKVAAQQISNEEKVALDISRIWEIPPMHFDRHLIELGAEAIIEIGEKPHRMPSGALHDASEMARAGIPTVMLFVQSLRGLSHTKEENTQEDHLKLAVLAFSRLAEKTVVHVSQKA